MSERSHATIQNVDKWATMLIRPNAPYQKKDMADAAKYQELTSKQKATSTTEKPAEEKVANSDKKKANEKVRGASFLMMGLQDGVFV